VSAANDPIIWPDDVPPGGGPAASHSGAYFGAYFAGFPGWALRQIELMQ
jgi:hypothetical protein